MLQPRIRRPFGFAVESLLSSSLHSRPFFLTTTAGPTALHPSTSLLLPKTPVRHASHAQQGRANGNKDSAGRRLGAKKTDSEWVIPGNIIFRQRGSKWHPGENVGMGRDHTIYATEYGYVRYYRDPARHPDKKFIGVSIAREGPGSVLPTPATAPRRRRLGMIAVPRKVADLEIEVQGPGAGSVMDKVSQSALRPNEARFKQIKAGYAYRESNWEIGKLIEGAREKVPEFRKGDRFLAWRKRKAKIKRVAVQRAMKMSRKAKGKRAPRVAKQKLGK